MIERVGDTQNMQIQAYGLEAFLRDVEELILRGYVFDFDDNTRYPNVIGHMFIATMVPRDNGQTTAVVTEDKKPKTRTPKAG